MVFFLKSSLKSLILLQKKIVRIMTFSTDYANTDSLINDVNILITDELVVNRISIVMYNINRDLFPSEIIKQ